MSSKVQICNLALARINGSRITSLTDNTNEAKLCNLLFNDIADEVMMEGPWPSVISRATLNLTTNTPEFGFTFEFQLPTSPFCLRVITINKDDTGGSINGPLTFRIEGNKLLANVNDIKIEYISRVTDTQSFDPALRRAIVSRLSSELSYPLTGSATLSQAMFDRYRLDVSEGLSIMTQQGSSSRIRSDDLDEVR